MGVGKMAEAADFKPRFNYYRCDTCRGVYTTVDVHRGTTPMLLNCRLGCGGVMQSAFYPHPEDWPVTVSRIADAEWYKPTLTEQKKMRRKARGLYDHVRLGGLILRPAGLQIPFPHATKE